MKAGIMSIYLCLVIVFFIGTVGGFVPLITIPIVIALFHIFLPSIIGEELEKIYDKGSDLGLWLKGLFGKKEVSSELTTSEKEES